QAQGLSLRAGQAKRGVAQISDQPRTGVRCRRLHARQSDRRADRRILQHGKLLYAAKVRNGFVPHLRREVANRLKGLEVSACPFANLPERKRTQWTLTKEEMKNCVWIKPELVVQIEFVEWTPDGHLRHSKFIGLREDKDPKK